MSGILGGAAGNVAYGGTVNPPRNRKGGAGNPPPTGARASALPDKWTPEARTPDLQERGFSVKVLIVNEKYPPYISGGAERSVQILAEELPTRRPP